MSLEHPFALLVAIFLAILFYFTFLFYFIPLFRANTTLKGRWNKYSVKFLENLNIDSDHARKKVDLRVLNKANELIREEISQFKKIEYFLYRSGFVFYKKIYMNIFFLFIIISYAFLFLYVEVSAIMSFFLAIFVGTICFYLLLRFFEQQWKEKFIRIFSQSLEVITRGLRVGLTTSHGISVVAEEMADPVGYEFSFIAAQLRVGVPEAIALDEAAARIDIDHFRFFAIALIIQKEMGGSLFDILQRLTNVIREREKLRKKIIALSAEGRITAGVVTGLPLVVYKLIDLTYPHYTAFFRTDPAGQIMTWISIGLMAVGFLLIKQMIKINV